ncbi:MAG: hypothetical protein EP315_00535 [Gammaproteobacteria bacterium]|nr:MAG: hypothetical protein EP315_00535 [Gammaproteobacteria bacterium]
MTLQTQAANNTESRVIVETTSADVLEQPPSLEMDTVPYLQDLPALVQQAIPDMTFAGHVYSSNPAQRSVIINGHAMGEGELVIDRLRVEQITRNGVVFNFDGQLFRMDILQDWSFN